MLSILTIGNSFANNATRYLEQLAAGAGIQPIRLGSVNIGGCSLRKHWNLVEQCDLLPEVRPYDFQITGEATVPGTLRQALARLPWDVVTLQQNSMDSWHADTYRPWFDRLHGLVRELAPTARVVIHQTWAYRIDAPVYAEQGLDQAGKFARIRANYAALAEAYDCPVIPVGEAWQLARARLPYVVDSTYDFADPRPLELPDQTNSLVEGYRWDTGNTGSGKAELALDPKHGNAKGCYLGNAVWFETFTGQPAAASSFVPEGIDADTLAVLRECASGAVAVNPRPWRR